MSGVAEFDEHEHRARSGVIAAQGGVFDDPRSTQQLTTDAGVSVRNVAAVAPPMQPATSDAAWGDDVDELPTPVPASSGGVTDSDVGSALTGFTASPGVTATLPYNGSVGGVGGTSDAEVGSSDSSDSDATAAAAAMSDVSDGSAATDTGIASNDSNATGSLTSADVFLLDQCPCAAHAQRHVVSSAIGGAIGGGSAGGGMKQQASAASAATQYGYGAKQLRASQRGQAETALTRLSEQDQPRPPPSPTFHNAALYLADTLSVPVSATHSWMRLLHSLCPSVR